MSRWTYNVDDVPEEVLDWVGKDPEDLRHIELRFLTKVVYIEETGCWKWDACTSHGYGQFRVGDTAQRAHRVSLQLFTDEDIDGSVIRHRCPYRLKACVRPDHVKKGSQRMNIIDAIIDGDMDRKFTVPEIRAIRCLDEHSELTESDIGDIFDTDQAQINRIIRREQYDWVE